MVQLSFVLYSVVMVKLELRDDTQEAQEFGGRMSSYVLRKS